VWTTACKNAGLPCRLPHDFRRTAVRNLERAAVPPLRRHGAGRRKTEGIDRRYDIANESMLREEQAERTDQPLRIGGRETKQSIDCMAGANDLLDLLTDSLTELLDLVGLADPVRSFSDIPHDLLELVAVDSRGRLVEQRS
jgi:hypothetical protein